MTRRHSRKQKTGEHTYLLTRIPSDTWAAAVARARLEHAEAAGCREVGIERCPTHNMRALLLTFLSAYGQGARIASERF